VDDEANSPRLDRLARSLEPASSRTTTWPRNTSWCRTSRSSRPDRGAPNEQGRPPRPAV